MESCQQLQKEFSVINSEYKYSLVTQKGEAYIYNCPYSSLCRQVVIDDEGRVMNFDFKDMDNPIIEMKVISTTTHIQQVI